MLVSRRVRVLCTFTFAFLAGCGSSSTQPAPDANPDAPMCAITAPTGTTKTAYDTAVAFTATASDPQDGTLGGASIVWRTDLATAPLGSGVTLSTVLPVGANMVTCIATDSTGLTGTSTPVIVNSKSPFAKINHPGNGEMRQASQAVPFVGVARDQEDGALTGASLSWTSSIDGPLGTGDNFSKTLTVGVHTITLTATDSNSNTDTDSITLTMQ